MEQDPKLGYGTIEHCSKLSHCLACCKHLLLSHEPVPCGINCLNPNQDVRRHEFGCRVCRSHYDLNLICAVEKLGGHMFPYDPLEHIRTGGKVPPVKFFSLHDKALPDEEVRKLNDTMIARVTHIAYTPLDKMALPKFTKAYVLDTVWQRHLSEVATNFSLREPVSHEEAERRIQARLWRVDEARRLSTIRNPGESLFGGWQWPTDAASSSTLHPQGPSRVETPPAQSPFAPSFPSENSEESSSSSDQQQQQQQQQQQGTSTSSKPRTRRRRKYRKIKHRDGTVERVPYAEYKALLASGKWPSRRRSKSGSTGTRRSGGSRRKSETSHGGKKGKGKADVGKMGPGRDGDDALGGRRDQNAADLEPQNWDDVARLARGSMVDLKFRPTHEF